MSRRKFNVASVFILILTLGFTILYLFWPAPLNPLDLKLYDEATSLTHRAQEFDRRVILIEIDEKSSQVLGTWPWPRQVLAEMVNSLAGRGAKVIGLCMPLEGKDPNRGLKELRGFRERFDAYSFSKKDEGMRSWVLENLKDVEERLDADRILVERARQAGTVVLPVFIGVGGQGSKLARGAEPELQKNLIPNKGVELPAEEAGIHLSLPFAELANAALGLGHAGLSTEDGMQGRSHPLFVRCEGGLLPSFPFRVAMAFLNKDPKQVVADPSGAGVQDFTIPLWKGEMLVDFRGAPDPLPHYSFVDVLQGDKGIPDSFRGKIVLLGLNLPDTMRIATPLSPAMPMVEFYGQVIQSVLSREFLARPSSLALFETALVWIVGLFAAFFSARIGCIKALTGTIVLLAAVLGAEFVLFSNGIWVKSGSVAIYIAVLGLFLTLFRLLSLERTYPGPAEPTPGADLQIVEPPEQPLETVEPEELPINEEAPAEVLTKIGRYDIIQKLGKGSMGLIYKALDPKINRFIAIKTIRFSDDFDPEVARDIRARFLQEAEIAGRLSHPCIVSVYDVGEDQGLTYMAMEFLEGHDLEKHVTKEGRLPLRRILEVVASVADALDFAHKSGVVHRDIKPANIMLLKQGGVKVTDFGIAKAVSSSRTRTGVILGTPNYMSPEQIMGQRIDYRSDIFSLGVLFYQLMSGELPFHGENLSSLLYEITQVKHPPLRELEPRVPRACEQVVDKALAKSPDHRFHSAGEMARLARLVLSKMDQMQKRQQ